MLLPADMEQLTDEDRANFKKLLGLLLLFLVGCGCWAVAWQRNVARSDRTDSRNVQIENAKAPTVELIQQAQQDVARSDRQ
ncbi:MAG: hypothetical protein JWN70_4502 [Planctomycetaceae bacterium]|nr:hypothetical protein [Planctomycetaceae bacterium]